VCSSDLVVVGCAIFGRVVFSLVGRHRFLGLCGPVTCVRQIDG